MIDVLDVEPCRVKCLREFVRAEQGRGHVTNIEVTVAFVDAERDEAVRENASTELAKHGRDLVARHVLQDVEGNDRRRRTRPHWKSVDVRCNCLKPREPFPSDIEHRRREIDRNRVDALSEEVLGKLCWSAPNVEHGSFAAAPLGNHVEHASVEVQVGEIVAVARHVFIRDGRIRRTYNLAAEAIRHAATVSPSQPFVHCFLAR